MLDILFVAFAIVLWSCYCCRRRGVQGLRRVPILATPKPKMTEEERLALIEKQLVTSKIGGTFDAICTLVSSAHSMYEANCCNCATTDCKNNHHDHDSAAPVKNVNNKETKKNESATFNHNGSQRSLLSRTWSAAYTSIAQFRQEECIICFEEYQEGDLICWAKTDQCSHVFHKSCAVEWFKRDDKCPLCRIDIINAKTVTYEEVDDAEDEVATDLELGASDDTDENEDDDEEVAASDDGASIALPETPEIAPVESSESFSSEENDAATVPPVEDDLQDVEIAATTTPTIPSTAVDNNDTSDLAFSLSDKTDEQASASASSKVAPTRSVDFTGSIHTNQN
ncbi:MAG: hypothetical protein SGBAC_010872 [Bacillariaceae sp.]